MVIANDQARKSDNSDTVFQSEVSTHGHGSFLMQTRICFVQQL